MTVTLQVLSLKETGIWISLSHCYCFKFGLRDSRTIFIPSYKSLHWWSAIPFGHAWLLWLLSLYSFFPFLCTGRKLWLIPLQPPKNTLLLFLEVWLFTVHALTMLGLARKKLQSVTVGAATGGAWQRHWEEKVKFHRRETLKE